MTSFPARPHPLSHADSRREPQRALLGLLADSASDAALVAGIRAGDERAFEGLFRTYYDPLCQFVEGYVGTPEAAEEVVSNLFLTLWEQREGWVVRERLRAYLFTAARNRALNTLRRKRLVERVTRAAMVAAAHGGDVPALASAVPPADDRMYNDHLLRALRTAIANLPVRYRPVVQLRWQHGMTCPEIAQVLGVPIKTVETQSARAVQALRAALSHFQR